MRNKIKGFALMRMNSIFLCLVFCLTIFLSGIVRAQITRYVDISGDDQDGASTCFDPEAPCRTVGHAVNVASAGDVIQIAGGAYTDSVIIDKSLSLPGAGQGITIIQAHPQQGMASSRAITISGNIEVEISDLTIRNGKVSGSSFPDWAGGGLFNDGGTLILTNITFSGNEAISAGGGKGGGMFNNNGFATLTHVSFNNNSADNGGGIYIEDSSPTLTGVSFNDNVGRLGGGGMYNRNSSPTIDSVVFNGNSTNAGWGGGMHNENSSPTLTHVSFINNSAKTGSEEFPGYGGGMYNRSSSFPTLTNVVFSGNSADWAGGGIYSTTGNSPTLTNVIFNSNASGNDGGGMYNVVNSPILNNVTFSGNFAAVSGGGMYNLNSTPTLLNCILWNNQDNSGLGTADATVFNSGDNSALTVNYSLVQGYNPSGDGNLDGTNTENTPFFVDMPNPADAPSVDGDLRLQENSPVINVGDPDTELSLFLTNEEKIPIDLDGNQRVNDGRIDLGAYEFQSTTSAEIQDEAPAEFVLNQNYPNPFNPTTNIGFIISDFGSVILKVYDVLGREVATLINEKKPAGHYEITFDAAGLSSGVYFYKLTANEFAETKKMILLQ